jgi:rod shape-determining protein MreC
LAFHRDSSPHYLRSTRRIVVSVVCVLLFGLFLIWRIDNARVEQVRMSIVDRFVPTFEWTLRPFASVARMFADFQSYTRVYQQNEELRRELQRMQGWREAALQLEQKNARLLALNNVRLNPRMTFVTGEIMADAGSPFRRSAIVNVGRIDGITDGSAVVDGRGLVGRISGVGEQSARIVFLTDSNSRVPAIVRPSGQRGILAGDNTALPPLEFLDSVDEIRPGDRVVSSGDGGLFPPDIPVGQVVVGPDGRQRVRLAADYRRLDFVRVVRQATSERIDGPGNLIGPLLLSQPESIPMSGASQ